MYKPDNLEEINFYLIDDIFSRIINKLGINLEPIEKDSERIIDFIKEKEYFYPAEISKELNIPLSSVHGYLKNIKEICTNFKKEKGSDSKYKEIKFIRKSK